MQKETKKYIKLIMWIMFVIYIMFLIKMMFIRLSPYSSYNLIPFKSIKLFLTAKRVNMGIRVENIIGNVAAFIPFSFFLSAFVQKLRKLLWAALITALFSLSLEILQFITAKGSFDVDDIILNTLGGIFGWVLFTVLHGIYLSLRKNIYKKS